MTLNQLLDKASWLLQYDANDRAEMRREWLILVRQLRDAGLESATAQVIASIMDDWERGGAYSGQSSEFGGYYWSSEDWQEIESTFPCPDEDFARGMDIARKWEESL